MNDDLHSDPNWDFYLIWHSCQNSKALINKVLEILSLEEFPNPELYQKAQSFVRDAEAILHEQFR